VAHLHPYAAFNPSPAPKSLPLPGQIPKYITFGPLVQYALSLTCKK